MDEYRQRESLNFEKVSRRKKRSKYLSWSLNNPIIVYGAILLMFATIILWMGSYLGSEGGIIQQGDVGTIALHDYKAPFDFTYDPVDKEATERIRSQRVGEVLPVYTWDSTYHDRVVSNVNDAFDTMRDRFTKFRNQEMGKRIPKMIHDLNHANVQDKRAEVMDAVFSPFHEDLQNDPDYESLQPTRPLRDDELREAVKAWKAENRQVFENKLGVPVSDEVYVWIVENNFSRDIQEEIVRVLNMVLSQRIATSRAAMDDDNRITVQWIEGGERRSKVFSASDKAIITTLTDSKSFMRSLVRERFVDAPNIVDFLGNFVRENITYDEKATERERQNVAAKTAELRIIQKYKKGQTIVGRGEPIRQEHYELFEKMIQGQTEYENRLLHWLGVIMLVILMAGIVCVPILYKGLTNRVRNRDMLFLVSGVLLYALGLKASAIVFATFDSVYHLPYSLFLIFPFAGGAMLMRIVISGRYAFYYSAMAVTITAILGEDTSFVLPYAILNLMAGCLVIERPKRSSAVIQAGALLGLIAALTGSALYMLKSSDLSAQSYIMIALLGFISGLLSSGVTMIGLPFAESLFGFATSNKLLELSNLEHPALKTLFMEAPGTYQHSIMVGSLNEAAADAIGANAILARVGGYYHDIGKTKNAQYFAENQRGDNPHNRLKPNMSALILKTHERDGLEIAKKYHLPQDIMDFIITHHGTSRIEFFYQRAVSQQNNVREEDYRYPGPRPQTRETGICMVSDMVEAAVRSMPDKSPDRIKVLVRKLINHKFADGQFDECDLTLRDLNDIADAVCAILNAFYHHRPEYPEQKKEREKAEAERKAKEALEQAKANDVSTANQALGNDDSADHAKTHPASADNAKKVEKSDKPDKLEKSDKTDKSEKSDKPDKSEKSDKPDKSEKSDKPDKSEKSDKLEKTEMSDNPSDKSDKSDKSNKTDKKDKSKLNKQDKNNKSDKSVRLSKTTVPDLKDKEDLDDEGACDELEKRVFLDETSVASDAPKNIANKDETLEHAIADAEEVSYLDPVSEGEASSFAAAGDEGMSPESEPNAENDDMAEANALLKDESEAEKDRADEEAAMHAKMSSEVYELSLSSHLDVFKKS